MILTVDRTQAPEIKQASIFDLQQFEQHQLKNNIPVYMLHDNDVKLIKVEMLFKAGRWFETKKLVSGLTAKLMKQGTAKHSSQEIAEIFDYYGCTVSVQSNLEFSTIRLFALPKYFTEIMELLTEVITEATFPQSELDKLVINAKQKLLINLEKSEYLAASKFTDVVFGASHPYGYNAMPEDFDQVTPEDLQHHHRQYYVANNCELYLTGCYTNESLQILENTIGKALPVSESTITRHDIPFSPKSERIHTIKRDGAKQASIRLGYETINKNHPDYNQLRIVNVLFGGYFGSRLMANIREDKGYTYGIYSSLVSLLKSGYMMISAEVGLEYVEPTLHEISLEINRLKNELAEEDELNMLKNYMLGSLMARVDGVFKMSNVLKDLHVYGLTNEDHRSYMQMIKETTPEDIMQYANKFLDFDKMYKVVVA